MKKFIKALLSDLFLKSILLSMANQLFDKIVLWLIAKTEHKIRVKKPALLPAFTVITQEILDLKVEDFISENQVQLNKAVTDV